MLELSLQGFGGTAIQGLRSGIHPNWDSLLFEKKQDKRRDEKYATIRPVDDPRPASDLGQTYSKQRTTAPRAREEISQRICKEVADPILLRDVRQLIGCFQGSGKLVGPNRVWSLPMLPNVIR